VPLSVHTSAGWFTPAHRPVHRSNAKVSRRILMEEMATPIHTLRSTSDSHLPVHMEYIKPHMPQGHSKPETDEHGNESHRARTDFC